MGVYLTKIGNTYNIPIQTYECDNDTDKSGLDVTHLDPGTRLHVIDSDKNYVLNNNKEWKEISSGGTSDYQQLSNKPKINNIELDGNKTTADLGITTTTIGTISLDDAGWTGSDPYTQVVTVTGITLGANDLVDLRPSPAQLADLMDDGVTTLQTENNNGTLTVYALGAAPSADMTIQCTITKVAT